MNHLTKENKVKVLILGTGGSNATFLSSVAKQAGKEVNFVFVDDPIIWPQERNVEKIEESLRIVNTRKNFFIPETRAQRRAKQRKCNKKK